MTRRLLAALIPLVACSVAVASDPPRYTVQVIGGIDPPATGGLVSLPLGMNNNGRVVGYTATSDSPMYIVNWKWGAIYTTPAPVGSARSFGSKVNIRGRIAGASYVLDQNGQVVSAHAVRWYGRQPQDLGTLGGNISVGLGIDDADRIVGYSTVAGEGTTRAFLWQNGVMDALPSPAGATETYAYDISNTGYIVGVAASPATPAKPYMWSNGVISPLPIPASSRTGGVNAVNNSGESVGTYEIDQYTGAFAAVRWENGQRYELGYLGGALPYAKASDVNNVGQIVGTSNSAAGYTGFIWMDGVMYDLRTLLGPGTGPLEITSAGAINDRGQIAAAAVINGQTTAIMLSPISAIPSPGTLAIVAGAGLIILRRRRW